ncbi:MAG TPA: ABC transporter permease [Pseudonocardiaceae bacterium]
MGVSTARRMVMLTLGAAVFSGLFTLSYGYAIHAPHPHGLTIDVVAPASTLAHVRTGLATAVPGGFDVRSRADEADARRDIDDTSSYGALVVADTGPIRVLTAGADGIPVQQAVTTALTAVAHQLGRPVAAAVDVVPLPPGDRGGQSAFVFEIGLLIPGVIGSVGFYLFGKRIRLWLRVAAAIGYALVSAAFGVLVLDTWLGALTGATWPLLGLGALAATAFLLTMAALHAVFGLPGTALGAGALLVVGNAINGSSVPVPLLPDGYRQLALWLPNGAAVRAFRDTVYFSGHDQAQPLLALTLWIGTALLIIALVDLVHLRHRRRTSVPHGRIHATPAIALLRHLPAPEPARHSVATPTGTRHGVVPARSRMPESVRRAIRLNLINELRALRAGRRYLTSRQSDLISGLIDARDYGLPGNEIDRVRAAALDLGFGQDEIDHLMRATGWPTLAADPVTGPADPVALRPHG